MVQTVLLHLVMQVVKLSDTVQTLPRQVTSNVHGVAQCFLDVGRASAAAAAGASVCLVSGIQARNHKLVMLGVIKHSGISE